MLALFLLFIPYFLIVLTPNNAIASTIRIVITVCISLLIILILHKC